MKKNILVTGAFGQIGSELIPALTKKHGSACIVALDKRAPPRKYDGLAVTGDITDSALLTRVVQKYTIGTVYHLASLLSVNGEKNPRLAWHVNMDGLRNVLDAAERFRLKVFWPSSIAVFGANIEKDSTPQNVRLEPATIYGITKVAGELLCQYYFTRYGVDVRSLRFPGIISYKAPAGGGTTDYAVEIFQKGLREKKYISFLSPDTRLPMMYIDDAIRATLEIMSADPKKITVRTSYNLAAMSFTPREISTAITKHVPLKISYKPDFRQKIADSWPNSIDDSEARISWGWSHEYDLDRLVVTMIEGMQRTGGRKQ